MKRLIASDLHGSLTFCEKLLDLYEKEGAQELILLGDLTLSGGFDSRYRFDPQGVIDLLNPLARQIYCVEGNCDYRMDRFRPAFHADPNYKLVLWEQWKVFLSHGDRYSPRRPPPIGMAQVMITGHTHVPAFQMVGDLACVNPGSVSLPRGGSPHSCLIWEKGTLRWLDLDGKEYHRETLSPP